jgi:hypothetical protein
MSEEVLPYIQDHRVTLYDARSLFPNTVNQSLATRQRPFYDLVLHQLQALKDLNPYEWMTCIDSDEFLVPKVHGTLPLFLEQFDPNEVTGIAFNGLMFGHGNTANIPALTADSVIESCQAVLTNEKSIKSIGSIAHSTYWHAHHPMGDKPLVNPEGHPTDFVKPVASYNVAFYAHYIQTSLESLNAKWQNANYPYPDNTDELRALRDIAMNRFKNNEWINYPNKDKFDPAVTSTVVLDLYNLRKQGLLPEPVVEPTVEPVVEQTEPVTEPVAEPVTEPTVEQTTPEFVDGQQSEQV